MIGHKSQLKKLNSDLMRKLVRRVVRVAKPQKILLFGSRARGDHHPDSDIDL
ncbi:MAG TPA: hypothetical protein DCQ92_12500, partial [Verrucomicrobia subdivision 3 bacterium]|nr:hypothetical protein [Limisphaerales bacterium]